MRLIDADNALKVFAVEYKKTKELIDSGETHLDNLAEGFTEAAHIIKYIATTVDAMPVVHGRWEYTPQTFNTLGQIRCPFCAWWSLDQSIDGIYKYCPNCGAKMDGGDDRA